MSKNVVTGVFFNNKKDPQRDIFQNSGFEYIKDWYNCIQVLKLNAIIFHDNLCDSIVKKYQTDRVKFVYDSGFKEQSYCACDYRWILYSKYFEENKYDSIFATDISDVLIKRDPFKEPLDKNKIYIGREHSPSIIKKNKWCKKLYSYVYGSNFKYWDNQILNCGIVGGSYDSFMRIANGMRSEIERINPDPKECKRNKVPYMIDMAVLANVAYGLFKEKDIVSGWPVHSLYKRYESDRDDVWFIHK
jgi:hypothetical protein